jgi:hypothetical protein
MADHRWLSMGDPAGSASPTPVAQYRVAADTQRSPNGAVGGGASGAHFCRVGVAGGGHDVSARKRDRSDRG